MSVFNHPSFDNHEQVVFCHDKKTGLQAIIAIHSTALGPAAGGCRQWSYANTDAALVDVLRLSQAMSYKNAIAGLRFGGGKAVVIKDSDFTASPALYERFGEFIDSLGGNYITAEDVGMTEEIMLSIARKTRFVTGLPAAPGDAGGDPSPKTAFGIFCGIKAAVAAKLGQDDLKGLRVAVQGVGNVGYNLCKLLHQAGAILVVSDINMDRVQLACQGFSAKAVALDQILFEEVDLVSPCALGAVLNQESIPNIKAPIVAGGANNQLLTPEDGKRISDADILYAPDYVINGGGVINIDAEYYGDIDEQGVMESVAQIGPRLAAIFEEAKQTGQPTNEIADRLARERISAAQ